MTTPAGSGVTNKGTTFADGSQVTSTNLNDIVDDAVFNNNAVDDTTIGLNSSSPKALFVKNSGIDTAQIKDDAVTQAKTSFIDANGNMTLSGGDPKIVLDDTGNGTEDNGFIQSFASGNMHIETTKAGSDVQLLPKDALIVKNDGTTALQVSSSAGKNATGSDAAGAQVTGSLEVTEDINCAGNHNNISIQGTAPTLTFKDSSPGATTNNPYIKSYDSGSLELITENAESDIILDAKDDVILQYNNNTVFRAGDGQGREADNDYVPGCKVEGALQVTGEANIGTTKLGADSILASSPAATSDANKIATTEFVHDLVDKRVFKEITTVGQASIASEDTFVDMPGFTIDIPAYRANRRFLLSGMLSLGARYSSRNFVFKWQYRKNGSGSWVDFTEPSSPGSRVPGHFVWGTRMDSNQTIVSSMSYKVRTPQLTHTNSDTINFKLVVTNSVDDTDVHFNRCPDDDDNDERVRAICQLEVEQL